MPRAADDDSYYMVPRENAEKCYALDADGKFTFQDKGDNTRVKVVKYNEPVVIIDGIESGAYYRICTEDGKTALSNNGSAANDRGMPLTTWRKDRFGKLPARATIGKLKVLWVMCALTTLPSLTANSAIR